MESKIRAGFMNPSSCVAIALVLLLLVCIRNLNFVLRLLIAYCISFLLFFVWSSFMCACPRPRARAKRAEPSFDGSELGCIKTSQARLAYGPFVRVRFVYYASIYKRVELELSYK